MKKFLGIVVLGLLFCGNADAGLLKKSYEKAIKKGKLKAEIFSRGSAWFDTGTHDSLLEASNFIYSLEKRQSLKIGSPEEVAWRNKWIDNSQLLSLSKFSKKNEYGMYLEDLVRVDNNL